MCIAMSTSSAHSPGCLSCKLGLCPPACRAVLGVATQTIETSQGTVVTVTEPEKMEACTKLVFTVDSTPEDIVQEQPVERTGVVVEFEQREEKPSVNLNADDVVVFSFQIQEEGSGQMDNAPNQSHDGLIETAVQGEEVLEPLIPRVEDAASSAFDGFLSVLCGFFVCVGDVANATMDGFVVAGQTTATAVPLIEQALAYRAPEYQPIVVEEQPSKPAPWAGEKQADGFQTMVKGFLSGKSHVAYQPDFLPMYEVFNPRESPRYDRRYEVLRGHLPWHWTELPHVSTGPPKTKWIWNPIYRYVGADYVPPGSVWCGRPPNAYERSIGIDTKIRDGLRRK